MKIQHLEKIKRKTRKERKVRKENFSDNLDTGIGLFVNRYLRCQSLTPLQRILVKCAHCRGIEHEMDDSMADCPVDDCPLYYEMCEIISDEDLKR